MPQVQSLQDFLHTDFSTKEILYPAKLNSRFKSIQDRINELNDVAAEQESHRASGTAPSPNVRGRLWADTSNAGRVVLKLDPDANGADDEVATRLETRNISFATGGTATHKLGGVVLFNAAPSGGANEILPANTLDEDGRLITTLAWGPTQEDMSPVFGAGPSTLTTHAIGGPGDRSTGLLKWFVVRTGAGAQKWASVAHSNRDSFGATTLCDSGTASEDETTDLEVGQTVTQLELIHITSLS